MNVDVYKRALGLPDLAAGGQELILGEIVASIWPCKSVWLPFHANAQSLMQACTRVGIAPIHSGSATEDYLNPIPLLAAVYFGTPTVVNGEALFPHAEEWTAPKERDVVRQIVERCYRADYRRVVCGLGSGDVSVFERCADLDIVGGKPATVVCLKEFFGFTDWVIVKDLREVTP